MKIIKGLSSNYRIPTLTALVSGSENSSSPGKLCLQVLLMSLIFFQAHFSFLEHPQFLEMILFRESITEIL